MAGCIGQYIYALSFKSIWSNGRGRSETKNYYRVLSATIEMWSHALELERRKKPIWHRADKKQFRGNKKH